MAENIVYTKTQNNTQGTPAFAQGKVVFDATAIVATDYVEIDLGFRPNVVEWENATDRTSGKWYAGMADNACVKTVAAGTRTLESVGITPTPSGFRVSQNATLALILASKTCYFTAQA